jgi:hypothetical protein
MHDGCFPAKPSSSTHPLFTVYADPIFRIHSSIVSYVAAPGLYAAGTQDILQEPDRNIPGRNSPVAFMPNLLNT